MQSPIGGAESGPFGNFKYFNVAIGQSTRENMGRAKARETKKVKNKEESVSRIFYSDSYKFELYKCDDGKFLIKQRK